MIYIVSKTAPKREHKQQQQHRVGVFDSFITILRQVPPPYFCSDFSLFTFYYIVLLFLLGYVLYEHMTKQKQQPNTSATAEYGGCVGFIDFTFTINVFSILFFIFIIAIILLYNFVTLIKIRAV